MFVVQIKKIKKSTLSDHHLKSKRDKATEVETI